MNTAHEPSHAIDVCDRHFNPDRPGSGKSAGRSVVAKLLRPTSASTGGMLLSMGDYRAINKALRDERAPAHAASADYGFDRFIGDPDYLSGVVRFDRPRLGDLTGQRGVHLQCHIGTDTLSLTRLGARMTGVDFPLQH